MPRLLHALALAALLAPAALALGPGSDPAARALGRVVEVELGWLGAQPAFGRHRHSVAELAAVREALRRALLFAHQDGEVIHRVLAGVPVDLDQTPEAFARRLSARARALGPHGERRWAAVTRAALALFALTRAPVAGSMAEQLHHPRAAPRLPEGFDFTVAPEEAPALPAWLGAGVAQAVPRPATGDVEMDLLASQVLSSLAAR